MRNKGIYAVLLLSVLLISACAEELHGSFVDINDGETVISFDSNGGTKDFVMYSDFGHWEIISTYSEDDSWITVWPKEGDGDARFSVKLAKNTMAASRTAVLNIVTAGTSVATLTFNQGGNDPVLEISVNESGRSVSYKGEKFKVNVTSNIGWVAEIEQGGDWLSLGGFTSDSQIFECSENATDSPRMAEVSIRAFGTQLCRRFTVTQSDKSSAFELAEKKSIAEILAAGPGPISGNTYVEGVVISNRHTKNYPIEYAASQSDNTMFIDDGEAGMWIEFENAEDNVYEEGDKLSIHLYGQKLSIDSYCNSIKLDELASSCVKTVLPGSELTPVVLESFADISKYENRLVTIKDVEFVLPYGTLVNINEAGYLGVEQKSLYMGSADYNDLTLEYGHYLRAADGSMSKLYTTWSFTERALHLIPEAKGDITGIVNKRYKADRYKGYSTNRQKEDTWCIRVRRESDITAFGNDPSTRMSKTIVQFGPWTDNKLVLSEVKASVGSGTLYHSVSRSVLGSTSGTTDQMYWAWAHARNGAATFDSQTGKWFPSYGNSISVQYLALMAQNWWQNTASQYSQTDGCCWIFSNLSTIGAKGKLYLEFTASSNTYGPIEFQLEWADNAEDINWHTIGSPYVCANWHCDVHAPEYVIQLPSELADREGFALRMRATIQRNASDNQDVANGTSRLGIVRISCLN